jgi:hypothetical protein
MASAEAQVDTVQTIAVGATAISADAISSWWIDSIMPATWIDEIGVAGWDHCPKPKDTARWYIKAIGEKCDSTYKKIYAPTPENPLFFQQVYERTITCKTDTTWAEKVQVWLRPEQLEKLIQILK